VDNDNTFVCISVFFYFYSLPKCKWIVWLQLFWFIAKWCV